MSDFFEENLSKALEGEEENKQEISQEEVSEPGDSKIKVGEKEYTQEELSRLVNLGNIAQEAETKFNTKIDRVWPEYTRAQNELKAMKEELAKPKEPALPQDQEAAMKEAREAAKRLGILTNETFEEAMGQSFRKFYQQEREAERLLDRTKDLEKEIDGSDGRPKFDPRDVLEFMADNNITNPETAYKLKYEKELDAWKEKRLSSAKKPGLVTESSSNAGMMKQPKDVKITTDNLQDLIAEQLYGAN